MAPRSSLFAAVALGAASILSFSSTGCSKPSSQLSSPPATAASSPEATGDGATGNAPEHDMNKKPLGPSPLSVVAQALEPKADALAFLAKAQAEGTMIKLPIEVIVEPLGISGGYVGFGADRITAKIDDTALGVALSDRVASWCGDEATRCAMWVWGKWRDGTILVTRAESKIKDEDRATATHLHVAK